MGLLERVRERPERAKAWSEPAFWTTDRDLSAVHTGTKEATDGTFEAVLTHYYKRNGIVFACAVARMLPFSEARFLYQEMNDGRPGALHHGPGLEVLEYPWAGATTGDFLARAEQMASICGNAYATRVDGRLRFLRADWITIITGVRNQPESTGFEIEAEILGYIYHPKAGPHQNPVLLLPDQVLHYAPIPDPEFQWRGMSWLTPVVREIQSDTAATRHKQSYFERGSALGVVIKYDKAIRPADYQRYVELFDKEHAGGMNAYKTLHLGGGADVTSLGSDLKSIDFKQVQGAGETRIAAAAGVGAVIAQLSEGLSGSSLNSGNYSAAKRRFADMTLRPMWRNMAGSAQKLTKPPSGHRLWVDLRDVELLKEDRKDAAMIMQAHANTVKLLLDSGFDADAVVDAVDSGDLTKLVGNHTGLPSVQLQAAALPTAPLPALGAPDPEGDE